MEDFYLNKSQLKAEVDRCLHCAKRPCENACPLHCSPHDFIQDAQKGNFQKAADELRQKNPLAHSCGLLCPDRFCQKACLRGKIDFPIDIPRVQATIMKHSKISATEDVSWNGLKIAVVGSGPAGLAAAWQLIKFGYKVVVFESEKTVGGALNMIPSLRLPREVVNNDWDYIKQSSLVSLGLNEFVQNPQSLLKSDFAGVINACGRQQVVDLGIPGEEFVVSYTDYLKNPQNYVTNGKVAIVGGGNVAVDCALTAKHQGAKDVSLFIRRKIFNMRVTKKEFDSLLENQIDLTTTTRVCKVEKENESLFVYTCSTEEKENGYEDIKDSIVCRTGYTLIIKAIGSEAKKENFESPYLINAGDYVIGASTVVEAAASGINAAYELHKKLQGETK